MLGRDTCEQVLFYGRPPFLVLYTLYLRHIRAEGWSGWAHCRSHDHGCRSPHCNCRGAEPQLEIRQSWRHDGRHPSACWPDRAYAEEQSLLAYLDGSCAKPDRRNSYRYNDRVSLQPEHLRRAGDGRFDNLPGVHGHGGATRLASVNRHCRSPLHGSLALVYRRHAHAMARSRSHARLSSR